MIEKMNNIYLLIGLLVLSDVSVIRFYRVFLIDFLIGAHNRKNAKKILNEQSFINQLTLAFIVNHLKHYEKAFRVYNRIYLFELITLIPQYAIVIILIVNLGIRSQYALFVIIGLKWVMFFIIRFQQDSLLRSKYRNGK